MRIGRTLLSALAGFLVFAPGTFAWHTALFINWYIGPTFSVKSADGLSAPSLAGAFALLMLGMAIFVPPLVGSAHRLRNGALVGSLYVSVAVNFHSLWLNGLYPGSDPASLYLMDTLFAAIVGALAGLAVIATHDRLSRGEAGAAPDLSGGQIARS